MQAFGKVLRINDHNLEKNGQTEKEEKQGDLPSPLHTFLSAGSTNVQFYRILAKFLRDMHKATFSEKHVGPFPMAIILLKFSIVRQDCSHQKRQIWLMKTRVFFLVAVEISGIGTKTQQERSTLRLSTLSCQCFE